MTKLNIAGHEIDLEQRKKFSLPVARLFDYTEISIPIEVIRGQDGPIIFVSAAIHGDEIIGVEIVKRFLANPVLEKLKGTIIAIPIVNPFGYNNITRYLPDRRDLNRCFPGSKSGSLSARVAHAFLKEIVEKCHYGIDIHSGAIHRFNFPQIRLAIADNVEMRMARAFGAPVIINSPLRPGTLRKVAHERGIKTILYEAGEGLRFDENGIYIGVQGIVNVLKELNMLDLQEPLQYSNTIVCQTSYWIRAPHSGSMRIKKNLGQFVTAGELLGVISDPYGGREVEVLAQCNGVIIGAVTMPLVSRGNALWHVATVDDLQIPSPSPDSALVLDKDIDIENEEWIAKV